MHLGSVVLLVPKVKCGVVMKYTILLFPAKRSTKAVTANIMRLSGLTLAQYYESLDNITLEGTSHNIYTA
jgi:hypothetical protein